MNLIIGLLLLATTANAVHAKSSTKIELTQEQKRQLTEKGKAMFLDKLKEQKEAILKSHMEKVKKGVSVKGNRGKRALETYNSKFMDGFSEVIYGFSGSRCTGNIINAYGNMAAQPPAIKALENSEYWSNCRHTENGNVAILPSQCEETADGYKIREYFRIHQDSHCEDEGTPVWGEWRHFDKCNEGAELVNENYTQPEDEVKSYFHACTKNEFPFNNNNGMYYFFYAPGTCGKKESPQYFQSVLLDDYCESTKGMEVEYQWENGELYYVNGMSVKYQPNTQMMQMKFYLEEIPQSDGGLDIIHGLGFKGGDICSSDNVIIEDVPLDSPFEKLYECQSTGEEGEYAEYQLQYMNSDGKITTVH